MTYPHAPKSTQRTTGFYSEVGSLTHGARVAFTKLPMLKFLANAI